MDPTPPTDSTNPTWVPLIGSVEVVVLRSNPVLIHGDAYVDLVAAPEDAPPAPFRIPAHQFDHRGEGSSPKPGDRLRLHLLMSQVDRVDVLSTA